MQLKKHRYHNHLQYQQRSKSLNKSYSSKQNSSILPQLPRQQTIFTQNNTNIEHVLGDFKLPSYKYTKQQNMILADELTEVVSSLRNSKNLVVKQMVRKRVQTQYSDLENSMISTQRLITDPGIVLTKELQNNQFLIDKEQVFENGVKYPFRLYMLNKQRRNLISQLLNNTNLNDVEKINQKNSKNIDLAELLVTQIKTSQYQKSKQALTSKNYMNNAFYSLLALNKNSQDAVKLKYRQNLPKDSRFHLM